MRTNCNDTSAKASFIERYLPGLKAGAPPNELHLFLYRHRKRRRVFMSIECPNCFSCSLSSHSWCSGGKSTPAAAPSPASNRRSRPRLHLRSLIMTNPQAGPACGCRASHAVHQGDCGHRSPLGRLHRPAESRRLSPRQTEERPGWKKMLLWLTRRPEKFPCVILLRNFLGPRTASSSWVPYRYQLSSSKNSFVGANDGACTSALLLAIADELRGKKLEGYSVWLAFFDGEESITKEWTDDDSLYGSRHLASRWQQDGTTARSKVFYWLT